MRRQKNDAADAAGICDGDKAFDALCRRAMKRRPEHADATWCSLSVEGHTQFQVGASIFSSRTMRSISRCEVTLSTDDKLRLMKAIRGATGARGIFILYEPTRRVDEDRAAFTDFFVAR